MTGFLARAFGVGCARYCYDYYYGRVVKRDEIRSFVLIHTKTSLRLLRLPLERQALLNYRANQMIPSPVCGRAHNASCSICDVSGVRLATPRSQVHLFLPETAYGFSVLSDFPRCFVEHFQIENKHALIVCFKVRIFSQYWLKNIQCGESGVDSATVEFKNAWDTITGFLTA